MLRFALIAIVFGGEPGVDPPTALQWVAQLGADEFDVREAASVALSERGVEAYEAVAAGADGDDPEIALRCRTLLPRLKRLKTRGEIQRAIESERWDDFPALSSYVERVGKSPEAIALLARAADVDPLLIGLSPRDRDPAARKKAIAQALDDQLYELDRAANAARGRLGIDPELLPDELSDRMMAVLVLGVMPDAEVSDRLWSQMGTLSCLTPSFRERATTSKTLRRLIETWCLRAESELAVTKALRQSLLYDLRDVSRTLARRVVDQANVAGASDVSLVALAIDGLGRVGEVEQDLPRIRAALADQNELSPGNMATCSVELGDVALCAAVRMTGQVVGEYGFEDPRILSFRTRGGKAPFSCGIPGFRNADDRTLAFARWRKWVADRGLEIGFPPDPPTPPPTPETNVALARKEAEQSIIYGRRYSQWAANYGSPRFDAEGRKKAAPFSIRVQDGRLSISGPSIPRSERGGTYGGMRPTAYGPAWVITDENEVKRMVVRAVDSETEARCVTTGVEFVAATKQLMLSRREATAERTLVASFQQTADKVILNVQAIDVPMSRTTINRTIEAADLTALQTSDPDLFALGLAPMLDAFVRDIAERTTE